MTFEPYTWKGKKAGSTNTKRIEKKEKTMLIYVWNLSPNVSEDLFRQTFEAFGQVSVATISSAILQDRDNGQLRRFAFVEMPDQTEAKAAIKNLNRKPLFGRRMIVYASSEN
jgi:RNA recognition motif-containing protein